MYSVGALLFYLLFGTTPKASHCESDAKFDFTDMNYDYYKCDGKLLKALKEFFNRSLAIYYADRYSKMDVVCEQLQKIERYADVTIPRIYSTNIIRPKYLFGREKDLDKVKCILSDSAQNCLFVTGMGGIGKSTLIKEYLYRNKDDYDNILYMQYKDSIESTISDDNNIKINTYRQEDEIASNERYFDKKINKICELTSDTKTIIVIDNFIGEVNDDLRSLLSTECKVVLITRNAPNYQSCEILELMTINDVPSLRQIFEIWLGRVLAEYEYKTFEELLLQIGNHTLILELIAKQIASSHISIESAANLTKEHGFSKIAPEKVGYEKDNRFHNDTIGNIIDALFESSSLSYSKKILMKVASLIGDIGIDINLFQQILHLDTKDDINELLRDGWLVLSEDRISIHHVIQETVRRWNWDETFLNAAEQFLSYYYIEIRLETTKNNYPKKLYNYWRYKDYPFSPDIENHKLYKKMLAWRERTMEKQFQKRGLIGKVNRERWHRINDCSPADMQKLSSLLLQAEDILRQCKRDVVISSGEIYTNLLYATVLNIPQYKKDIILAETNKILSDTNMDFIIDGTTELLNSESSRNPIAIMQLYAKVILIYAESQKYDKAEIMLKRAKKIADTARHHMVYAQYYNLLSDYYDILLNGAYDAESDGEKQILNKLNFAIEKTLQYSKKSISHDVCHLYIKNILAKATILMRSMEGTSEKIVKLINIAGKMIEEYTLDYADVRLQYYLVCAWYYALECEDIKTSDIYIQKAEALSELIMGNDLQKIEELVIPCANIYFELGLNARAIDLLFRGTRICVEHCNTDKYDKLKQELCDHIWQVGIEAQLFDLCEKILRLIDCENHEIVNVQNKVTIPDGIREVITSKKD